LSSYYQDHIYWNGFVLGLNSGNFECLSGLQELLARLWYCSFYIKTFVSRYTRRPQFFKCI